MCIRDSLRNVPLEKTIYYAVAANDWEACAAYVRGMVDQIQR